MKKLLFSLLFFSSLAHGQVGIFGVIVPPPAAPSTYLDSAMFNFSATTKTFTNVTNLAGNPHTAIRTGTGAYGIGVSSIATARWTAFSSSTSADAAGENGTSPYWEIPTGILANYFFQQVTPDCTAPYTPNIEINGLVAGATYTILVAASRLASAVGTAQRYMSVVCTDASGDQRVDDYDIKGNVGASYVQFTNKTADANGKIFLLIQSRCPTDGNHSFGYISFLKIKRTPR